RWGSLLRERNVNIVVNQDDQACLGGEVEDTIHSRVLQARHFTCDLCRDELLMYREFADSREYTRESLKDAPDVVRGIHIRRVETRDHGIEASLLPGGQGLVCHGDPCVRERVVV